MLKNYLTGATDILKYNHKSKYVHRGYGMEFHGSRGFGNDFAGNVVVFGVDNSSSSCADNRNNSASLLREQKFNINLNKAKDFASVCIIIVIKLFYSLTEKNL